MKKAFLTMATVAAVLGMTAGAHAAASCELELKDIQAAGEDFATKYMDIGVIPAKTIISLKSQTDEDSLAYLVTTINHDATHIRSVKVGVSLIGRLCKIRSLEAID